MNHNDVSLYQQKRQAANHLLKIQCMKVVTYLSNGVRFLANHKNGSYINFATEKAAHRNAKKYAERFGVPVTVVPDVHEGKVVCYKLSVEKPILN